MIIYRIQDGSGRGPFRPGFSNRWVEPREDHANLLPWTMEFPGIQFPDGLHIGCGCKTLDQLKRWFTLCEYRVLTKKYGFRAVAVNADFIIRSSDNQTVFANVKPLKVGVKIINLYGRI